MSNQLKWQQRRDRLANELAESFINGNGTHVVGIIHSMSAEHAAVITAKICCILPKPEQFAQALAIRTRNDLPDEHFQGDDEKSNEQDENDDG
jgi:hypothetical protein